MLFMFVLVCLLARFLGTVENSVYCMHCLFIIFQFFLFLHNFQLFLSKAIALVHCSYQSMNCSYLLIASADINCAVISLINHAIHSLKIFAEVRPSTSELALPSSRANYRGPRNSL